MNPSERLIVALDVPSAEAAMHLAGLLDSLGCRFKVGLELFTSAGPEVLKRLDPARVFLDLKFHDIPNTVAGAARAVTRWGVGMFNVHACGGVAMMHAAAEAARDQAQAAGRSRPLVLGVTVLTSLDRTALNRELGIPGAVESQVSHLARLALHSGLDGVVCSPQEIRAVRESCGPEFVIVTPGVRPAGSDTGDQNRISTPAVAVLNGANYLVVGRPITAAEDPRKAAVNILEEMSQAPMVGAGIAKP